MGGKGGGGGGGFVPPDPNTPSGAAYWRADIESKRGTPEFDATYGNPAVGKGVYDLLFPAAAAPAPRPAPAPAPVEEPAPAPPAAPAPVEEPKPLGPPISVGEAVKGPQAGNNVAFGATGGTGGMLGESVLDPPKYWVGGIPASPATGRGEGKITKTST